MRACARVHARAHVCVCVCVCVCVYITRCRAVHCFIHVQYVLFQFVLYHNFLKVSTLLLCVIHPFTPSPSPQQAITTPQLLRWLPCHSLYEAGGSPHTTTKVVVSQPPLSKAGGSPHSTTIVGCAVPYPYPSLYPSLTCSFLSLSPFPPLPLSFLTCSFLSCIILVKQSSMTGVHASRCISLLSRMK